MLSVVAMSVGASNASTSGVFAARIQQNIETRAKCIFVECLQNAVLEAPLLLYLGSVSSLVSRFRIRFHLRRSSVLSPSTCRRRKEVMWEFRCAWLDLRGLSSVRSRLR